MAWVGGANEATGATSALTGALNSISDNINTVASAAGVLAAIGGSRFIGGMIGDLGSQTAQLVEARKNEIALAAAGQILPHSHSARRPPMHLLLSEHINWLSQNLS